MQGVLSGVRDVTIAYAGEMFLGTSGASSASAPNGTYELSSVLVDGRDAVSSAVDAVLHDQLLANRSASDLTDLACLAVVHALGRRLNGRPSATRRER